MSFLKIPFIAEIPDNERIQKKLEKFWQIESFETKTTNVCEISCNDILFNEDKSVYQVWLPFKEDHDSLPIKNQQESCLPTQIY